MLAKFRILLVAALMAPGAVYACFWVEGTTLDSDHINVSGMTPAMELRSIIDEKPENRLDSLTHHLPAIDINDFSNEEYKAVEAILKGNLDDGIQQLEKLEKDQPGHYSTASNLGTAYELKGDIPKALQWITEGLKRNPDSHYGTEWLHQLILEVKIKMMSDPQWLQRHRVLELDETRLGDPNYYYEVGTRQINMQALVNALNYQLSERIIFVKPPDPIVADLLYSYGLLTAQTQTVENAEDLMELSQRYGFVTPSLIDQHIAIYNHVISKGEFLFYLKYVLGVVVLVLLLIIGYKKKLIFLSSRDYKAYKAQQAFKKSRAA